MEGRGAGEHLAAPGVCAEGRAGAEWRELEERNQGESRSGVRPGAGAARQSGLGVM